VIRPSFHKTNILISSKTQGKTLFPRHGDSSGQQTPSPSFENQTPSPTIFTNLCEWCQAVESISVTVERFQEASGVWRTTQRKFPKWCLWKWHRIAAQPPAQRVSAHGRASRTSTETDNEKWYHRWASSRKAPGEEIFRTLW
jgi:hypothetical protein